MSDSGPTEFNETSLCIRLRYKTKFLSNFLGDGYRKPFITVGVLYSSAVIIPQPDRQEFFTLETRQPGEHSLFTKT